jgi:hypothetical protein
VPGDLAAASLYAKLTGRSAQAHFERKTRRSKLRFNLKTITPSTG